MRPKNFQSQLRVERLRIALQSPEYKALKRAELEERRKAGWKPRTDTPAQRAKYQKLAEERRGKPRDPRFTAGLRAANALKKKPRPDPRPCQCGCGGMVVPNCKGNLARYIRGHTFHGATAANHTGVARRVAKLRGTHGHGLGERGRLDHYMAKYWVLRDPVGRVYECSNMTEWVRQNLHLFHDYRPESRNPFWRRVSAGLAMLNRKLGDRTSYLGWVLVSVSELRNNAPDLLGRDEAAMSLDRHSEDAQADDDEQRHPCATADTGTVRPCRRGKDADAGEDKDDPVEE